MNPERRGYERKKTLTPWQRSLQACLLALAVSGLWSGTQIYEMATDTRLIPTDPYAQCGDSTPERLVTPAIGIYDENPDFNLWNKLEEAKFVDSIAVAAKTEEEYLYYKNEINTTHPHIDVKFWALLSLDEGYYPGPWSDHKAVERIIQEVGNHPVLWDSEMPFKGKSFSFINWYKNKTIIHTWLLDREERVDVWRAHETMGLNPLFLRLTAIHSDPNEYPNTYMHLELSTTGEGLPDERIYKVLRCGVEEYGEKFVPSFGMLNDLKENESLYIPLDTLKRYLVAAQNAGVSEVWLFSLRGLSTETIDMINQTYQDNGTQMSSN
jgi:hypothetical protein